MSEQYLDDAYVFSIFEQMSGEAMPERVRRNAFLDARQLRRFTADLLDSGGGDVLARFDGGKQPRRLRALAAEVFAQHLQQTGR